MFEDLFMEKLNWFKLNEKPEVVLLIANSPELVKFVVAWTNLDVKQAGKPTNLKGKSENEVWEWLWQNISYSRKAFIEKLGIPLSESSLEYKLKPLIGNRVLYPDGTVNSFVQRYLKEQVVKLFETKL